MNVILTERPKRPPLSETEFDPRPEAGDTAMFTWHGAMRVARGRAAERGCRQQVRLAHGCWLIQDVR